MTVASDCPHDCYRPGDCDGSCTHPELTARPTAWLIERNDDAVFQCPHWYHEEPSGWHWWTPRAHEAKQFATRSDAEAFPAYRMISGDPSISLTEHVFMGGHIQHKVIIDALVDALKYARSELVDRRGATMSFQKIDIALTLAA